MASSDSDENETGAETREFDIASPLSEFLREVIEYTGRHRNRFGDDPVEGSVAKKELNAASKSKQRLFDIEATHQKAAGICILSAGYLFSSLTQLYRPDMSLFGFQVVARAIVENSMKAWWLVDPAAATNTRLARMYADNLENINQMTRAERLGQADASATEKRRKELVKRAVAIGIAPLHNRKNQLIGFGDEPTPGATAMAGRFFEALGYKDGEAWYRRLSAICHGTAYGLLDHYTMVDVPDSELKALVPRLPLEEVLHIAILSMQAYLGAVEFDSRLMGWDADDVARQRTAFFQAMIATFPQG